MSKYLVIVESPAKVKTIKKFLGSDYEVLASNGHVRDLPKSKLGIDIENNYEPQYITIRGKGEVVAKLRKAAAKANKVYLATDPDREGEAISWHLAQMLKLDDKKVRRITFNEITKDVVKASIKASRPIDMPLVDSQQTRRMVDRMVGYMISPILWEKVKSKLSAGRVQSVALRLLCDRESQINEFVPNEYWTLVAPVFIDGSKKAFEANFYGKEKEKLAINNEEELNRILEGVKGKTPIIKEVKNGERIRKAPNAFITSTLQQEADKTLNFSAQKTMRIAQSLYEGVEIAKRGTVGIITYLRTDSIRISEEAEKHASEYIEKEYGKEYVSLESSVKKTKSKIQDAHEAIRPTDLELTPEKIKQYLSRDEFRLYSLIWKRFVASRMTNIIYETKQIKIMIGDYRFSLATSKKVFDGFSVVYSDEENDETNKALKNLDENSKIEVKEFLSKQHFTQPPARYTEASLVKTLEEQGIGRPSTYAPIIGTLLNNRRRYVVKENKCFYTTEIGEAVNQLMVQCFPSIVDVGFTANFETLLDSIEEGTIDWKTIVQNFYPDLEKAVEEAKENAPSFKIEDEVSDVVCDKCGRMMVIKYGRNGKFLACPGFPECRNAKSYFEKIGVKCPKCQKEIVIKKTQNGRTYYGCEDAPACDFMSWAKPTNIVCERCGGLVVEKGKKLICSNEACSHIVEETKKA